MVAAVFTTLFSYEEPPSLALGERRNKAGCSSVSADLLEQQ